MTVSKHGADTTSTLHRVAFTTLAAVLTLAACSTGPSSSDDGVPESLVDAEFIAAYEDAQSDFIRDILRDGVIDRAEVLEAVERTHECWEASGVDAWLEQSDETGRFALRFADWELPDWQPGQGAPEMACLDEWFGPIQHLYPEPVGHLTMTQADSDNATAACLVRRRLAPPGFTGQMLNELWSAHSIHLGPDHSGAVSIEEWEAHVEEVGHPIIPETGVDLWGDEALVCILNPFA